MAEDEVEVTWDDQQNINKFGRLNNRLIETKDELSAAKAALEDLREAENETMLTDAEYVKIMVGEVFVSVGKDPEILVQKLNEAKVQEIESYEEKIKEIKGTLAELKVKLYSKFKDQINLEDGEN
jgi:prefoldin subunit 4